MSMTITTIAKSGTNLVGLLSGGILDGLVAVKSGIVAHAERRRVYAELSHMSDRDLADIGISRADIAHVAGYPGALGLDQAGNI